MCVVHFYSTWKETIVTFKGNNVLRIVAVEQFAVLVNFSGPWENTQTLWQSLQITTQPKPYLTWPYLTWLALAFPTLTLSGASISKPCQGPT